MESKSNKRAAREAASAARKEAANKAEIGRAHV